LLLFLAIWVTLLLVSLDKAPFDEVLTNTCFGDTLGPYASPTARGLPFVGLTYPWGVPLVLFSWQSGLHSSLSL
jgi:hypothetical protein